MSEVGFFCFALQQPTVRILFSHRSPYSFLFFFVPQHVQRQFQKTFGPFPGVLKPVLWHPGCKMVTISWKEGSFFSAQGGTRSVQVRKDRRLYEKNTSAWAQRAKKGVFLLSFRSKPQFGALDGFPAFFWAFVGLTWLVLVPKVRETSACD